MGTNSGAHLELLGWWSKSTGGSVVAIMDKRLRMVSYMLEGSYHSDRDCAG